MHEMFICIRNLFTHKLNLAKFYNVECEIASMTPLWAVLWFFVWHHASEQLSENQSERIVGHALIRGAEHVGGWVWGCSHREVSSGKKCLFRQLTRNERKIFLGNMDHETSTETWWQITVDWGLFIHSFYQDFLNSASPENAKMIKTKSLPTRCRWTQVELEAYSLEVRAFFFFNI